MFHQVSCVVRRCCSSSLTTWETYTFVHYICSYWMLVMEVLYSYPDTDSSTGTSESLTWISSLIKLKKPLALVLASFPIEILFIFFYRITILFTIYTLMLQVQDRLRVLQKPCRRIEKKWSGGHRGSWLASQPQMKHSSTLRGWSQGKRLGKKRKNGKGNASLISSPPLMWPDSEGIWRGRLAPVCSVKRKAPKLQG